MVRAARTHSRTSAIEPSFRPATHRRGLAGRIAYRSHHSPTRWAPRASGTLRCCWPVLVICSSCAPVESSRCPFSSTGWRKNACRWPDAPWSNTAERMQLSCRIVVRNRCACLQSINPSLLPSDQYRRAVAANRKTSALLHRASMVLRSATDDSPLCNAMR